MDNVQGQAMLTLLPDDQCRLPVLTQSGLQRVENGLLQATARAMSDACVDAERLSVWEKTRRSVLRGDTAAWRGALAAALLMECWSDECRLEMLDYTPEDSAFVRSALAASGKEGLRLAVLRRGKAAGVLGIPDAGLGLLLPAARSDLAALLPERLHWYDRERQQFTDPCASLCQRDRVLLARRLRLLKQTGPVALFAADVEKCEEETTQQMQTGKDQEMWSKCLKAVVALSGENGFGMLQSRELGYRRNPGNALLRSLEIQASTEADARAQLVYTWREVPIAYSNDRTGVELISGSEEALQELWQEYGLLARHSRQFARALPGRITDYLAAQKPCFEVRAQEELTAWCAEMLNASAQEPERVRLSWPWRKDSPAVEALLAEYLPETLAKAAIAPFSERLTLLEDASLGDTALDALCRVTREEKTYAALLPLSDAMALEIAQRGWPEGMDAAVCMQLLQTESGCECTLFLTRDQQVSVTRAYAEEELRLIAAAEVPELALWPAVSASDGRWQPRWLCVRGRTEVRCAQNGAWASVQGTEEEAGVLRLNRMPRCAALYEDDACLGVIGCQETVCEVPHLGEATIALDVGSSGTAAVMLLGGRAQPITVSAVTKVLLCGQKCVADQMLPVKDVGPIVPTAVIKLQETDDPRSFADGSICLDANALENGAEGNLLWRTDARAAGARKLYFQQLMLMCGFHAVMSGADSVSWRVTLPSAMAREGRQRLMREIEAACAWAEREAGIIHAPGAETLYQRGSMAAGLYLRDGGIMHGAFAMVDVGSTCTSMALWLRGMNRPATEFHVHGGIASMLLPELSEDPALFVRELGAAADAEPEKLMAQTTPGMASLSYNHLLIDRVLGEGLNDNGAYMNACFRAGSIPRTQALLIMGFAALMTLTGNALEQVRRNPLLNDYLPPEMQLALCGRGSLVLAGMDPLLANAMTAFVRVPMSYDHPVRMLSMTLSGWAKLEAAMSVSMARTNGEDAPENTMPEVMPLLHLMVKFLVQLRTSYPWHVEKLFPGMFDGYGRFTQEAEQRITAAADKCSRAGTEEGFLRSLDLLRSAYRIQPEPVEDELPKEPPVHHFCAT